MKSANGTLILILGILSFVGFGILTGLPAWLMGNAAMKDIDAGLADPNERSLVSAGRILGMIATILSIIGVCLGLAFVFGLLGLIGLGATQSVR